MTYTTAFIPAVKLDDSLCTQMFTLYHAYYEGSNERQFIIDLKEKREAVLLFDNDILVGFTTWMCYEHIWNSKLVRVIFSGDTIVHQKHWGQQNLAFAKIKRMAACRLEHPQVPLYWFLLVKGHRTFRYLPAFAISWFPHWNKAREHLKPLADSLASTRYGEVYNPTRGVVEFPISMGHLKKEIAYPSPKELEKKEVRFFLNKNPLFYQGHELVCICELTPSNLRPIAARIFEESAISSNISTIEEVKDPLYKCSTLAS